MPTGNEYSWGGDSSVRGGFGLSAEIDVRRFFVVVNSGLQLRPRGGVNDLVVGSEWRWGAGAFVPLRDGALRLGAQVLGATGITEQTFFDANNTPLEWMIEARLATDEKKRGWIGAGGGTRLSAGFAPDVRVVGVAGYTFGIHDTDPRSPGRRFRTYADRGADTDRDGLPDDIDLCPNEPEDGKPPNHDDGCPTLPDRDQDGIPDISDLCPDVPEDLDGVRDGDGCPEDDGDQDDIPDAKDACPKVAGVPSPIADRNGCPRGIGEGKGGLFLLQQVQFETGKATILAESFPILDEVVRVLQGNPDADRVTVEGHTDNTGPDELNERLSADRARSVMRYLIEHGIEGHRVTAKGFGPRVPIDDNGTPQGRKKNRRVEFKLSADTQKGGKTR
jgi:outer membrane protein OmpA-like peptidoglycan-associated protein